MSEIQNILDNGFNKICEEACKCGVKFELYPDGNDGVIADDDEYLSFTTSIIVPPFNADDGLITPKPITFELMYDRSEDEFNMAIGEDPEHPITYGNVMAYMYFNSIQ